MKKFLPFKFLITLLCSILFFASCKNPAEDVDLNINADIFKSPSVISFSNGNPNGTPLSTVNVTFSGPQAGLIKDIMGGTNFKVSNGFLNIVLDKSANPTVSNPIKATAILTAVGFAPTHIDLVFTDPKENYFFSTQMIEYAKPPESISIAQGTASLSSGTTTLENTFTTTPNSGQSHVAKVTIPKNTKFYDVNGKLLTSGQLDVKIAYSTLNQAGQANFAAFGFINNIVDVNNKALSSDVGFLNLAGASIKMTVGTTTVKSFSQPVQIEYEIPSNAINKITNKAFAVGDVFDKISKDDNTGLWKNEPGTVVISKNASNKLVLKYETSHLSVMSSGFFSLSPSHGLTNTAISEHFYENFNVKVSRNKADVEESFKVTLELNTIGNLTLKPGELTATKAFSIKQSSVARSYQMLNVVPISQNFYFKDEKNIEYGGINIASLKAKEYAFNFDYKENLIKTRLMVTLNCTDKNFKIGPTLTAKLVDNTDNTTSYINLKSGIAEGTLTDGHKYTLYADFQGQSVQSNFTAYKIGIIIHSMAGVSLGFTKNSVGANNSQADYEIQATISRSCK